MVQALHPRYLNAADLAQVMQQTRARTLDVLTVYQAGSDAGAAARLIDLPYAPGLNPMLWEFGHIGWFEEAWIGRNPALGSGHRQVAAAGAVPDRRPSSLANADRWFDSMRVAHTDRWTLDLPDLAALTDWLAQVREQTLQCLHHAADDDEGLYHFRLALMHEAMHQEAWLYMAQNLDLAFAQHVQVFELPATPDDAAISLLQQRWKLGSVGPGFAFDNELAAHEVLVPACSMDVEPVSWRRYLPFVEAGGYRDRRWWDDAGWSWLQQSGLQAPRFVRTERDAWVQRWSGVDRRLEGALLDEPACHLTQFEAQAWCRWAGRQLPTEAQWECAVMTQPQAMRWGRVWEWTASPFAPFDGFRPHPYRDYSEPWFDGRPVLRGASWATDRAIRHPKYRNFFPADRNDIVAGFRSCVPI